ncbi:hypothetical protein [uncultured Lactobacillus sp.]|uniref:hypothetical protein n=1 Tax=uncultured Lactobacillus sp. TaxID=153152 RepID=UPI00262D7227|nr:hypothetical protein [uncultured Lactobacillus sp.]
MSKKLVSIEFGFENCEVGVLPIKSVPIVELNNIQKDFAHNWRFNNDPNDEFSVDLHCESAHFVIDYESASKVKTNMMEYNEEYNLARRFLYWKNLSSVTIHYDDKSSVFIWLPYEELNPHAFFDTCNKLQTTITQDDFWEVGINSAYNNHQMIIVDLNIQNN